MRDLDPLRVMTWNIGQIYWPAAWRPYLGDGLAEAWMMPGVAACVRQAAPDVVFLQEVKGPAMLATLLGALDGAYAGALVDTGHTRQLAALHRVEQPWTVRPFETGAVGAYPRALSVEGRLASGARARLIGVHATGCCSRRRAAYFDGVIDALDARDDLNLEVVAGDFNIIHGAEDGEDRVTMRWLRARLRDSDPGGRWPTFLGVLRLDYVLYRSRPPGRLRADLRLLPGALQGTQDHAPVVIDLVPSGWRG